MVPFLSTKSQLHCQEGNEHNAKNQHIDVSKFVLDYVRL